MTERRPLLTRDQILERLEPYQHTQLRPVADASEAKVILDDKTLLIRPQKGARTLAVESREGLANTLRVAGLPLDLAKALSPETFATCLNELLARKQQYSLVVRDNQVTDIVPYRENRNLLSPERVIQAIEKQIPVAGYNRLLTLDRQRLQLEIVGQQTAAVVPGDLVQAGVMLRFSPLNVVNPVVQAYALRLECTNGATSTLHFGEFGGGMGGGRGRHNGDSDNGSGGDFWPWFRLNLKKAYGSLDKVVAAWQKLVEEKVSPQDRAAILTALLREAHLRGEVAEAIRAQALERPPQSNWDLFNYITYASSHLLEAPKEIVSTMEAAANYASAESHARLCPVCHHQYRK